MPLAAIASGRMFWSKAYTFTSKLAISSRNAGAASSKALRKASQRVLPSRASGIDMLREVSARMISVAFSFFVSV